MKKTWVFNDLHLGVARSGGTTQASATALRLWALDQFDALLKQVPDGDDVIINGDLTDQFDIPLADAAVLYGTLMEFAEAHPASMLRLALGNHDRSKDSTKLGTVEFLCQLLAATHTNVLCITAPASASEGVYVIPHVVNQAVFDLALSQVPGGTRYLLLHCNFASPFAEHADHSLNISRDQARDLVDRGITLVLGHEHHQRVLMGGKVVIPGNQVPTSIADCVTPEGRQISEKQFAVLTDEGVTLHQSWRADDEDAGFRQVSIEDEFDPAWRGFIRITGDVMPEDAADALRKISRLRQASNAFVIVNAVKVRSAAGNEIEDALEGIEDVRGIDVIQMLLETLTKEQQEAVRAVLATQK